MTRNLFIVFWFLLGLQFCSSQQGEKDFKISEYRNVGDDKVSIVLDFVGNLEPRKTVRFFAVGHRIDIKKHLENEQTFYESYKKYMDIIKPYFSRRYINFVVFEEHAGLPLIFFGERGRTAREQAKKTIDAAFYIFLKFSQAVSYYTKKFPDVSTLQGRQLFLALTDTTWRVFYNTFSSLAKEYGVYVASCQNTSYPAIEKKSSGDIEKFVDEVIQDRTFYYEATTSDVWNTCFIFSPDGQIVHKTRKVNLVPSEKNDLQFSSGRYEELEVFRVPGTDLDVCIAISLDAFVPDYIRILDEKGCDVLLQPDANAGAWAGMGGLGYWQTYEWIVSTLGSIQTQYYVGCTNPHVALFLEGRERRCDFQKIQISWKKSILFNVNPMMTGNLFDTVFDGQTAITGRDGRARRNINYIGNPPIDEMKFNGELNFPEGGFIVLGPWSFDINNTLSLEEQQRIAREYQSSLSQGGQNENKYISTVVGADLSVQ